MLDPKDFENAKHAAEQKETVWCPLMASCCHYARTEVGKPTGARGKYGHQEKHVSVSCGAKREDWQKCAPNPCPYSRG